MHFYSSYGKIVSSIEKEATNRKWLLWRNEVPLETWSGKLGAILGCSPERVKKHLNGTVCDLVEEEASLLPEFGKISSENLKSKDLVQRSREDFLSLNRSFLVDRLVHGEEKNFSIGGQDFFESPILSQAPLLF